MRVGVLMPRSTLYPYLGTDVLLGFKQFPKESGLSNEISLQIDNIGFGTDEQNIYAKAEKWVLQDDLDMVIVFADVRIQELLQPLFTALNKVLLMINMGANLPDQSGVSPNTISYTLGFSFLSKLTGMLAAQESNKQIANVISYYDGGYRICYNMINNCEQAGGVVQFNHVTKLRLSEFSLEPLDQFSAANPEVTNLLCMFSGETALKFYSDIQPLQKKYGLKLYVAPAMADEYLKSLPGEPFSITDTKAYIPWHQSLSNEANLKFISSFKNGTGKDANYFSLIGWDAAQITASLKQQADTGVSNPAEMISNLLDRSFESPRGLMKLDADSHQFVGPCYLANITGYLDIQLDKEAINSAETWHEFLKESLPAGESSSWKNTYLCI